MIKCIGYPCTEEEGEFMTTYSLHDMYYYQGRGHDPSHGDVSDLDPRVWSALQMRVVALGRGCRRKYGDVSDLHPKSCTAYHMEMISLQRGRSAHEKVPS